MGGARVSDLVGVLLVECFSKATPACPSTAICDVGEALCPCRFTNCTIHLHQYHTDIFVLTPSLD